MKKILIGTHNRGKFKEISFLLSSKFRRINPTSLKIPSPKESGRSFVSNSKLKANFFSKYVDYPVISDDSGLCIKTNQNLVFTLQDLQKAWQFLKAMKYILKKMKEKE